eukprot:scaffold23237_cov116-Isochrysis_galbana.AAC.1
MVDNVKNRANKVANHQVRLLAHDMIGGCRSLLPLGRCLRSAHRKHSRQTTCDAHAALASVVRK